AASAATRAWAAFAVTDTSAPAISSDHGYHAARCRSRATTATVATTISPSTSSGHTHACPTVTPERAARSARAMNDSQNAPAAIPIVPVAAETTAHPHRSRPTITTPAPALPRPPARRTATPTT